MSMTDPVADMFARIRNGSKEKFEKVDVPSSKLKREIVRILKDEGFIKNFKVVTEDHGDEMIRIFLKYDATKKGIIHIKRVSKPGRRIYVKSAQIPSVLNGYGVNIVSTPQGIFTDREARKLNLGGELLCSVW